MSRAVHPTGKPINFGKAFNMGVAGSGMNKKTVAYELEIRTNYLYDICCNSKSPSIGLLINAAKLFKVKLSTLISWGEEE